MTHFPMFEYSPEEKRYNAMHHPFTSPLDEDLELLESAPEKVRSRAYDLVLNGNEIGGGSIRIHRPDVQAKVFEALHIGEEEAREKFGFLIEALGYGAPPHGGIAFGLDRLVMILTGSGVHPGRNRLSQNPEGHLPAHRSPGQSRSPATS